MGYKTNRVEKTVLWFKEGFLCSQAVLASYAPRLGMAEETAFKIACAFRGGVVHMGGTPVGPLTPPLWFWGLNMAIVR